MKHIFLVCALFAGISFSFAGNGNGDNIPSCNCPLPNKVDIYAAGRAELIGTRQIKCSGDEGKCWEVTFDSNGGWTLTIFTDPIITLGNDNTQDNPPTSPVVSQSGDGFKVYTWDPQVWK